MGGGGRGADKGQGRRGHNGGDRGRQERAQRGREGRNGEGRGRRACTGPRSGLASWHRMLPVPHTTAHSCGAPPVNHICTALSLPPPPAPPPPHPAKTPPYLPIPPGPGSPRWSPSPTPCLLRFILAFATDYHIHHSLTPTLHAPTPLPHFLPPHLTPPTPPHLPIPPLSPATPSPGPGLLRGGGPQGGGGAGR
jgi:hypothetical protein